LNLAAWVIVLASAAPVFGGKGRHRPRFPSKVSPNGRFPARPRNGKAVFFSGWADTAWELFHRLDPKDADLYLRDRGGPRGFTVIQGPSCSPSTGSRNPKRFRTPAPARQ